MGFEININEDQQIDLLRALKTIALANQTMSFLEFSYIESLQKHLLNCEAHLDSLDTITADELSRSFITTRDKKTVLGGCILLALVDGEAGSAEEIVLKEFENGLGFRSKELEAFMDIRAGRIARLKKTLGKRSFGGHSNRVYMRSRPIAFIRQKISARLKIEQPLLVKKYHALGSYNEDSLGKHYFNFLKDNALKFPGETGSLPEHLIYHDLTHILAEFGTTPDEEILAVAFQSAYQDYNPFFSLLTAISLFHLGLPSAGSEVARPEKMKWQPDTFFRELARGMKCSVDLSDGWDHWEYMRTPISEVRDNLNIKPRFA